MPDSQAQVRLAHSVVQGQAANSSMPVSAAKEIISKMQGRKMSSLPKKKRSDRAEVLSKLK